MCRRGGGLIIHHGLIIRTVRYIYLVYHIKASYVNVHVYNVLRSGAKLHSLRSYNYTDQFLVHALEPVQSPVLISYHACVG